MSISKRLFIALLSAGLLVGCGSGGGSSDTPMASTPAPTPSPKSDTATQHPVSDSTPAPDTTPVEAPAPDTTQPDTDPSPMYNTAPVPTEAPVPDTSHTEAPVPDTSPVNTSSAPQNHHTNTRTDSGMTSMGNILGFDYEIRNEEDMLKTSVDYDTEDFGTYEQRPVSASYTNEEGFRGIARNSSFYEPVTADVKLNVTFKTDGTQTIDTLTIGQDSGIDLAGRDYGYIKFSDISVGSDGRFNEGGTGAMTGSLDGTEHTNINGRFGNDYDSVIGSVDMKHTYPIELNDRVIGHGVTSLTGVFASEQD